MDAKTQAILDFLQSQAEAKPELLEMFTQMGDLYARKLWHQLTVLLESFFLQAAAAELLIPIYETFVTDFKHRLNRLALSRLQVCVAKQYKESEKLLFFGNTIAEDAKKDDCQSSIYILSELACLLLELDCEEQSKQRLDEATKLMLKACQKRDEMVNAAKKNVKEGAAES